MHPRGWLSYAGHKAPRQPRSTNHNARISRRVRAVVISPSCLWADELVFFGDCLCTPRNTREYNIIGTCSIIRLSSPGVIIPNGIALFESLVVIIITLLSAFRITAAARRIDRFPLFLRLDRKHSIAVHRVIMLSYPSIYQKIIRSFCG